MNDWKPGYSDVTRQARVLPAASFLLPHASSRKDHKPFGRFITDLTRVALQIPDARCQMSF